MILLLTITHPQPSYSQGADPVAVSSVLTATFSDESIDVDGLLDDEAWQKAEIAPEFRQYEPSEGAHAAFPTEVRVVYGPNSIFVGAKMHDDEPDLIQQTLGRRDEYRQADWFTVAFDPHLDLKTAYTFAVSAAGVQYDALQAEDTQSRGGPDDWGDASWDAIWKSDVRVTPDGWTAEIEIPYSMLRFSEAEVQTWGIQFSRRIPRLGEISEWPLVPRTERANLVASFGRLQGISGIEPRRNMQITPYTMSRLRTEEHPERAGRLTSDRSIDAGVDLKLGLGSNMTLNATVNPDFGQVESDPAELNLTAFETFFPERRPFFVEGMHIFQFPTIGSGSLLYTRRIGAEAPIIGAAKLSGRTEDGLSFGFLGATTGDDFDPTRHYAVARATQQIGTYSSAGGMLTGFDGPERFDRRRVLTGGADWDLRFRENTYGLRGFAAFMHELGAETGLTGQIMAERRQGAWTYEFGGDFIDHRFNPNDIGRQQRNNAAGAIIRFQHDINGGRPVGAFQRARVHGSTWHQWSYREGLNLGGRAEMETDWVTRRFERLELEISAGNLFGGYDLFETRGLWPSPKQMLFGGDFSYQTDERRDWQVQPEFGIMFEEGGGRSFGVGLNGRWNAGSRLSLRAEIELELEDGTIEWASNETFRLLDGEWSIGFEAERPEELDPDQFVPLTRTDELERIFAGVPPYDASGHFYVPIFGLRDTRAMDATLRTNYTFTPNLSLQFYGQLFLARARYEDFQILKDADTRVGFAEYPKRNEFSRSSFQFNTVLRWEYRPGSVLFLVWTQERRADDRMNPLAPWGTSPFDRAFSDQISDTFGIFPGNVFLVKLSYTFLN